MQEDDEDDFHPQPPPPPPKEGGEVDADEVTAKLIFYYPFETEPCDRHAFNEGALLSELNAQATMISDDFPLFTKGVVRVPKGQPASVLLPSEELADRFLAHTETLIVDAKSRDGKECLATLRVEKRLIHLAEKLALAPPRPIHPPTGERALGKRKAPMEPRRGKQARHTAWLEVRLDDDEIAMNISMSEIVQALVACGLKVTKRTNVQAKVTMEDEEGASRQQSLGDDFKTHRYNFDVTTADGSPIREFPFGTYPYIPMEKKFRFQGRVYDRTIYLSYAIGGPAIADIEAENRTGKPVSIFCGSEYGCKRLRTICNGKCQQARNAKEKHRKAIAHQQRQANEQEEAANRQAAARLAHQERARAKTSRENAAKALIMAPPQRSDKKCPHLLNEKGMGMCSRGLRCRYDHSFFGTPAAIATIPCGLGLRPGGNKCLLGDACIYRHANPEDSVPYSPASSFQEETETRRAPPPPRRLAISTPRSAPRASPHLGKSDKRNATPGSTKM